MSTVILILAMLLYVGFLFWMGKIIYGMGFRAGQVDWARRMTGRRKDAESAL